MTGADLGGGARIGIYVRESRDDNEENLDTIETQRDLLISLARSNNLGTVVSVYTDDNVSGSAFEREGLERLKRDVFEDRIDLLLLKDLSRLGRNNARTLLFLDFLEENGIRILTSDGRYDSTRDNDTVGIETWYNERYVRDISRKIRSTLKFKIEKGEYLGHAPYGYRKSDSEKNRLIPDEEQVPVVRSVFRLYRSGLGYKSIAGLLNERGCPAPGGGAWSQAAVRRILCNRVYTGDTVQGVSEKISFKSKKTRRKPREKWVITPDTHEPLISKEEFLEAQSIREGRLIRNTPHKSVIHPLRGMIFCGGCGSIMYSRRRCDGRVAYVCSKYYTKGSGACRSHLIYETLVLDAILEEIREIANDKANTDCIISGGEGSLDPGGAPEGRTQKFRQKLERTKRQQEMLYNDRLEGKISEQLFERMNVQIEARIAHLLSELESMKSAVAMSPSLPHCLERIKEEMRDPGRDFLTYEIVKLAVSRVTVYDPGDAVPAGLEQFAAGGRPGFECGIVSVDFRFDKV